MSVGVFKKIVALEMQVLQRGDEMSVEEARQFYNSLISYQKQYVTIQNKYWSKEFDNNSLCEGYYETVLARAESVEKKIIRLQEMLKKFIEPVNLSTSPIKSKVNPSDQNCETDQPTSAANHLNSFLQKQKFYIRVIDSLVLEGELSSDEAELHFEHVSHAYKEFISNQSEIMTFYNGTAFDDQLNIFHEVQRKVLSLQLTLHNVFSPSNTKTLSVESKVKVNEHFNRTDLQNVIVDFLDSLYKKQKSLIGQIELIESKNNLGATEAETLHNHVSQLHEAFNKNQAKIETYVNGPALDKELEMSREILVKVMSLQTKLKNSAQSSMDDECKEVSKTDDTADAGLISLIERQKSLMNDIESMKSFEDKFQSYQSSTGVKNLKNSNYFNNKREVESSLRSLLKFKQWFISNQTEIEKKLNGYDLHQQKKISKEIQTKLKKFQIEYEYYHGLFAYLDLLNDRVYSSYDCDRVVSFTR